MHLIFAVLMGTAENLNDEKLPIYMILEAFVVLTSFAFEIYVYS